MHSKISDAVWNILSCPQCGGSFRRVDDGVICTQCALVYPTAQSGAIDLRLRQPKRIRYEFELGAALLPETGFSFGTLPKRKEPAVDYSGVEVPFHLTSDVLEYFPRAETPQSLMLDLGCGSTIHREVCEHAGFEYIGLDISSENAMILGDAHALPFKDASFEFILSVAVLEHIRFPFVMMKEACRVLKPNGIFIGTVAFLEPFHEFSFYHHTSLGTYNSLREGGFKIEFISPSSRWSSLIPMATMSLFPGMPRSLSLALAMPLQAMHKMWWRLGGIVRGRSMEQTRAVGATGAFTFIAYKEGGRAPLCESR